MSAIPDHKMFESQAMMTLKGPLEKPERFYASRAGEAVYFGSGGRSGQVSKSLAVPRACEEQLRALEKEARRSLAQFENLGAQVSLQVLIRERRVSGIADYHQSFAGFWGTIRIAGAWDSVLGGGTSGELQFRRGPWESWPREGKTLERTAPETPMVFSPYCATVFHEAVGHGLEAEYQTLSPLHRAMGARVSRANLYITDSPNIARLPGSMSHDDAGRPATETMLIYGGILVGDLSRGRGVVRRGNYRELPMVRAGNFMIRQGTANPSAWLTDLTDCYYIAWINSGNWQPGTRRIKLLTGPVFHLHRGEVVAQAPWLRLELDVFDLLDRIADVGNDARVDPVVHWCVKRNQSVPMGLGSPSLLVEGRK